MAKKSSNPVDAFRKAQRAKELKKNKELRGKVRETQTIKKDTRDIEREIRSLKDAPKLDATSKTRLSDLEAELSKINKVKEKYVSEHPEARDRIFRTGKRDHGESSNVGGGKADVGDRYDSEGRLRDPTRSVYFDPVYNPWGAPPPGMPYKERTPEIEEDEEDDEEEEDGDGDDSDDEIIMPEGPPPGSDADSDDSDDIPLPEGPPPPKSYSGPPPSAPSGPSRTGGYRPAPPPIPAFPGQANIHGQHLSYTLQPMGLPFRPPYQPIQAGFRPPVRPHIPHDRVPNIQDPLSDAPTQTYQGHRIQKHELPVRPPTASASPFIITNPSSIISNPTGPISATGEISAAPVLRDLRKEAVAFVPRGVKRKQAKVESAGVGMINAAPGAGVVDADGDEVRSKRVEEGGGLIGKLKGVLKSSGVVEGGGAGKRLGGKSAGAGDDDYQEFLKGLGELG